MQRTDAIQHALLELHRVLVDEAHREYEWSHGSTTAGELLELLVSHETFAWLQPFTSLIVELDEQEPGGVDRAWADRARGLLRPDAAGDAFQQRYEELVQRSPDVVVAHGAVMRTLRP